MGGGDKVKNKEAVAEGESCWPDAGAVGGGRVGGPVNPGDPPAGVLTNE